MEARTLGFHFSPTGELGHTIYIEIQKERDIAILTVQDEEVELRLDSNDLELFGQMCIDLSERMKRDHELRNACIECGGMLAHHEYCSMYVKKN